MPPNRNRLGSGFDILEEREMMSANPYEVLQSDIRTDVESALIRVDATLNKGDVSVQGASITTGVLGDGYAFTGSDQSISVAHQEAINFERNRPFTITASAKVDVPASIPDGASFVIFEKGNMAGNQASVGMAIRPEANTMDIWLQGTNNSNRIYFRAPLGVDIRDWHTYTFTFGGNSSSSGVHLYVDGTEVFATYIENNLSTSLASTQPGTVHAGFGVPVNGSIDNLFVYDRALSNASVQLHAALPRVSAAADDVVAEEAVASDAGPTVLRADVQALLDSAVLHLDPVSGSVTPDLHGATIDGDRFVLGTNTASLSIPHSDSINFASNQSFSFGAFVTADTSHMQPDVADTFTIFEKGDFRSNQSSIGMALRLGSSVMDIWMQGANNTNRLYCRIPLMVDLSAEHHYLLTYNGSGSTSGITLFVDGVASASPTYTENSIGTSSARSTHDLQIGAGFTGSAQAEALGSVKNVTAHDRRLTESEALLLATLPEEELALAAEADEDPESYVPHMDVVSVNRALITLNVTLPPTADAKVTMQYGLSVVSVDAVAGTNDTQATIELSPYVRGITDTYTVYLEADGVVVDSFPIVWDAALQQFTANNEDHRSDDFSNETPFNPLYDIPMEQQWESGEWDIRAIMTREGIGGLRGGATYGPGILSIDNNPDPRYPGTTFQRIDVAVIDGDANITSVKFLNESGLHTLPPEYYQLVTGKTLIVKPNAPAHIVIQVSGDSGTTYGINTRTEPSAYNLAPKQEMSMSVQTLQVRMPQGEGWVDYPTTYSTFNERGTEGSYLNMLYSVVNEGLSGGDVVARVKVGDGSASDQVLATYTRHFNPQEFAALSVNVTLPSNRAFVYLEVTLADGRTFQHGRIVQEPRDATPEPRPLPTLPADIHPDVRAILAGQTTYSAYAWNAYVIAIAHKDDVDHGLGALGNYADAWNKLSNGNPIVVAEAVAELTALGVPNADMEPEVGGTSFQLMASRYFDLIERSNEELTFGSTLNASLEAQMSSSLQFYWHAADEVPSLSFPVKTNTAAGRIFLGMIEASKDGGLPQSTIAVGVQKLMGIPASQLLSVLCTQSGFSATELKDVFIQNGYGYLFSNAAEITPSGSYNRYVGTHVSFNGQLVSLSIDTGGDVLYAVGEVYVRNLQNNRVSSSPVMTFRNTLTVDIPTQYIADLYGGEIRGDFTLEVILKDGTGHVFSGATISKVIPVDTLRPVKNLSTNPDERARAIENYIFSNIEFPLENADAWHQTFGSGEHDDEQFNAFDLNLDTEDGGQIVRAMAAGTISDIGFYTGGEFGTVSHIDIRHEADISLGGQMQHIVWTSRYLHMAMSEQPDGEGFYTLNYNGGSVRLKKDMFLTQSQIIGGVSNVGSEANHFHGDVHVIENGVVQDAIDFNPYLRDLGIGAKAKITAQGEKYLDWDLNAKEWSYTPLGLFYHRNEDGSEHFLAMTSQKEEIVYDETTQKWIMFNSALGIWSLDSNNKRLIWNGSNFSPEQ